ncbi:hypothetical protein [Oceanobacillus caeni]|uniref:hypothetical protein n=1 Tax=Oceanobacillus caeni TaxID=405946 RepID=UPI002E20512F|nr:hypothetical protein [Oceanobacillus caeni]
MATIISNDSKMPELIIAPTHANAVIKTNGTANFFMEAIEEKRTLQGSSLN